MCCVINVNDEKHPPVCISCYRFDSSSVAVLWLTSLFPLSLSLCCAGLLESAAHFHNTRGLLSAQLGNGWALKLSASSQLEVHCSGRGGWDGSIRRYKKIWCCEYCSLLVGEWRNLWGVEERNCVHLSWLGNWSVLYPAHHRVRGNPACPCRPVVLSELLDILYHRVPYQRVIMWGAKGGISGLEHAKDGPLQSEGYIVTGEAVVNDTTWVEIG